MVKVINRIYEYLKLKDFKVTAFEKSIEVGNGYLKKADNRNSSIGSDVIERIANKYPELSIEWLITGNGSMLKGSTMQDPLLRECLDKKNQLTDMLLEKDAEIKRLKSHNKRISSKS